MSDHGPHPHAYDLPWIKSTGPCLTLDHIHMLMIYHGLIHWSMSDHGPHPHTYDLPWNPSTGLCLTLDHMPMIYHGLNPLVYV